MDEHDKVVYNKILEEHKNFSLEFDQLKELILKKDNLVKRMARHPLYEIEPFEGLIRNEFITDEELAKLYVESEDEIDPETDKLYTFLVDPGNNRIYHRIIYDERGNYHETLYWYEENWHKSMDQSVYKSSEHRHGRICYTFFKNGLPDLYLRCKYAEIKSKKYQIDDGRVIGYQQQDTFFSYTANVTFEYDASGHLDLIKEYGKDSGIARPRPQILFKRPQPHQNPEVIFEQIEDFLVARITEKILGEVRIKEDVYCLMLEYFIPEAFPPEIALAVVPDLEGKFETLELHELYSTPDMRYYSGENGFSIDLYVEEMEYLYLQYYRAYDFFKYNRETFEHWDEIIKQVYLKICKRLMHADFSSSFTSSPHYLVMARGDGFLDTEYFHDRMKAYKNQHFR